MRPGFLLAEVGNGMRRNLSMVISVVLVTMVALFLFGLGLMLQQQVSLMKGYWYDRIQVSVYLCNTDAAQPNCEGKAASDQQKATIKSQLEALPEVKEVFYESEQEAFDRFKEQFRNSPVVSNTLRVGDIPDSYRVSLKDPSKYAVVTSQFDGAPGVASVQDQERVLKPFFTVINRATWFAVFIAVLLVVCAALLIMTTVRQVAFARRREIGIMRLVGASNFTIRTPFVVETLLASVVGALGAIGLVWASVHYLVTNLLSRIVTNQALIGSSDVFTVAPWLLAVAVVVAVSTTMLTLWRYLRV